MSAFIPSPPQLAQLKLLRDLGAVSRETAKGRHFADGTSRADRLNPVMLGVAMAPKGVVGKASTPPWNGEPARRLYWITAEGLALLDQFSEPAP